MNDHKIVWVHNFYRAQSNYNFYCSKRRFLFFRNLVYERKMFIQKAATGELTKEECLKLLTLELNVMAICSSAIDVCAKIINY